MLITKAPKGTQDLLPEEIHRWHFIEDAMRTVCALFGYREVRVPTFEHTELFTRSVGDTTDIVQKEMYTFIDKGGRSVTLKPEGTAGVARAFVEHSLYAKPLPQKMYYLYSPVFRYERPQAGRLREHHQFGVEVFGAASPTADAEVIALALHVLSRLGLGKMHVHINSIGCPECRPGYQHRLRAYYGDHRQQMCPVCSERYERNPLRLLDCKVEGCRALVDGAPSVLDSLCEGCADHFGRLKEYLRTLKIDYIVDPRIVRGLDYYTRTVFEIIATEIGAQSTVCGGGRYDGLISDVGGPPTPGIGFGMGMERLLILMEKRGVEAPDPGSLDVFVVALGEPARREAVGLVGALREAGIRADLDHAERSAKAQFRFADRLGCRFTLVIGDEELSAGTVLLREMARSTQQSVPADAIINTLRKALEEPNE
ncbi:MAG: histidine--tRNA ligase [Christensenellales bacterium]|jgi:histidyl-tRNA synthetase